MPTTDAELLDSCAYRMGNGRLTGGGFTLSALAGQLTNLPGRFVRDKTGLTGYFVIDFAYGRPRDLSVAADRADPPSIFVALQEQLGLKLEADRMPLQSVVIDHIERPTKN
jgi:uncharacterized protein (TIGR03435 family)